MRETSLTGQAVVTLQLCILHGPLLLICERGGLADGRQQGGRGLGAGVRIPQHPAQPLNLQQSAVILANRLSVLLILVALGALALEVQRPPDDVGRLVVRWLLQHRPTMMPLLLLLELLLVSGIFGPAAAAAAAAVGRLSALLEPRGAADAVGVAASAAVHPAVVPSFHYAHFRRYLIKAALTPGWKLAVKLSLLTASSRPCSRFFASQCRSYVFSVRNPARCALLRYSLFSYFTPPMSRLVDKYKASIPMRVLQQEEERFDHQFISG